MKTQFKILALVTIVVTSLAISACGKNPPGSTDTNAPTEQGGGAPGDRDTTKTDNGGGAPGTPGSPANPTTPGTQEDQCQTAWNEMVKSEPVGRFTEVETTIKMTIAGVERVASKSKTRKTILEASAVQIKSAQTTDQLSPVNRPGKETITTFTHEEFMKFCTPGTSITPDNGFDAQVLEKRDETIKVRAGTFETHYGKIKLTSKKPDAPIKEMISETWNSIAQPGLLVKSIMTSESTTEGMVMKNNSTSELIQFK
jgi:hypothetical protein